MDLGLKGKTALVAASSRGLGRAVADELAKEGANLVICARTVAPLEEAGREIYDETGADVVAVPTDLTDPADVDRLSQGGIPRTSQLHGEKPHLPGAIIKYGTTIQKGA